MREGKGGTLKNYLVFTSILISMLFPVFAAHAQDQNRQTLSPKAQRWIEEEQRWLACHPKKAMEELRFVMHHGKKPYRKTWAAAELLKRNPSPYYLSEIIAAKKIPEPLKAEAWERLEQDPTLESLWNILHRCSWPFGNHCKEYSRKAGKLLRSWRQLKKN